MNERRILILDRDDNIAVATCELAAGSNVEIANTSIVLQQSIDVGHKFALRDINADEPIIKYQTPIGHATKLIKAGEYVHTHNMVSDYLPTYTLPESVSESVSGAVSEIEESR